MQLKPTFKFYQLTSKERKKKKEKERQRVRGGKMKNLLHIMNFTCVLKLQLKEHSRCFLMVVKINIIETEMLFFSTTSTVKVVY